MTIHPTRWILLTAFVVVWTTFLYLPPNAINSIAVEDGPVENASAFFWLISCGLVGAAFLRSQVIWHLLLAFVFFLCFGEEVSWGQRIFGFSSPGYFTEHNLQGEMNIHNLDFFDRRGSVRTGRWQNFFSLGRLFSIFWFSYFCVLPRLVAVSSFAKHLALRFEIPVIPSFFGPFLIANYLIFKYYEILHPELCAAMGLRDHASMSNLLGETRELYEAFAISLIMSWEYLASVRRA
jgi:hypothetical protein